MKLTQCILIAFVIIAAIIWQICGRSKAQCFPYFKCLILGNLIGRQWNSE